MFAPIFAPMLSRFHTPSIDQGASYSFPQYPANRKPFDRFAFPEQISTWARDTAKGKRGFGGLEQVGVFHCFCWVKKNMLQFTIQISHRCHWTKPLCCNQGTKSFGLSGVGTCASNKRTGRRFFALIAPLLCIYHLWFDSNLDPEPNTY